MRASSKFALEASVLPSPDFLKADRISARYEFQWRVRQPTIGKVRLASLARLAFSAGLTPKLAGNTTLVDAYGVFFVFRIILLFFFFKKIPVIPVEKPAEFNTFCSSGGGKAKFASQDLGRRILCPLCRKTLILRTPANLKMARFVSKETIEFHGYALQQTTSRPHDNMDNSLKEFA
jgi:hypothetical protein